MYVVLSTGTVIKCYHIEQYLGINDRQVMMRCYIIDRNAIEKRPSVDDEFHIKWVKGQMYVELSAMSSTGDYVHHIDGRSRPDIDMPEGIEPPLATSGFTPCDFEAGYQVLTSRCPICGFTQGDGYIPDDEGGDDETV